MHNEVTFTVRFDSEVWTLMTNDERADWIDKVTTAINEEAYVAEVATR